MTLIGGGGTNPVYRYIEDYLVLNGWPAYVATRVDSEAYFQPDATWFYLPWGYNGGPYDFCALQQCTGVLERVADSTEFLTGMKAMYAANGRKPLGFYMGNPTNDPTLSPLWASSRTAWYQRVEAAVFPIGLCKARGIPVMFCIDAAGTGIDADQCTALLDFLAGYGEVWYEPRPLVGADVLNVQRYGSITQDVGFSDDYTGFGSPPIPEARLVGRRMILCQAQLPPADYAAYIRGVGKRTGGDILMTNNDLWRGKLRANAFRVTVR